MLLKNCYKKVLTGFLFFISLFITSISCDSTEPPPTPDPTNCIYALGNRNFTWQIDTVALFPSNLGGIWSFSDSDAYLMGNIFQWTDSVFTGYVGLHWNGNKWDKNLNGTVEEIKHVSNDVIGDDHYLVSVGNWSINPPKPALGEFNNNTKKWKGLQFQIAGELRSVWTDGNGYFIAAGDYGMVYIKENYAANWIYVKAPTDFHFTKVIGISKTEVYFRAVVSLSSGQFFDQIWKYYNKSWIKLLDNQDTLNTPIKIPEAGDEVYNISVYRCSVSDSLYLYIVGRESFEFSTKGNSLIFNKTNLRSKGLSLASLGIDAGYISVFSPNDYWISSFRYYLYHFNGIDFQKIETIPALPYGQLWGYISQIRKNKSGKIWILVETNSQSYSVIQGVP
jgi:hypothetical protein